MRILLLGANGLIGSAVAARLSARGDEVVAVTRSSWSPGLIPIHRVIHLDIADMHEPRAWLPHLAGIDAVVNCAGTLQDSPFDSTAGVHSDGIGALFTACEQAGVRRIVHLSAIGVDRATPSNFSKTKLAGDVALIERDLDWVILRPSVVFGPGAYGATALMRGLASLPVRPVFSKTAPLQIVHLNDVVDAVLYFTRPGAPARRVVELAGPRTFTFDEAVALLRSWFRWPPAATVQVPPAISTLAYRMGDLTALLGWRPPVRSTAGREIVRGATGDLTALQELGMMPRDFQTELAARPASVQERWFAKLYFLKPAIFILLPVFWIGTGLISLTIGWDHGMGLMREGGVSEHFGAMTIVAGAAADIAIGALIAWRPTSRWGLWSAVGICVAYAIIGTVLVPRLWLDPLGPMLKIWPILVLHLVALAILEDR